MSKPLTTMAKATLLTVKEHGPEILTGFGITGLVATSVMSSTQTVKAMKTVDITELTKKEIFKQTWKYYIPPAILGTASIACLIGSCYLSKRRSAALAAAYALSEVAFTEYKDKVVDLFGEEKGEEVEKAIIQRKIERVPYDESKVFITGKGNDLCFDVPNGRYFRCDIGIVKEAILEIEKEVILDSERQANEFYYKIGLPQTGTGKFLGWSSSDGNIEVDWSSRIEDDNQMCAVINYPLYLLSEYSRKIQSL